MKTMQEKENVGVIRCFRCEACAHVSVAPKLFCPQCGQPGTLVDEKVEKGVIVDVVPVAYPPEDLKHLGSYVSALVKLDNGCSLFGIVAEEPNRVEVGKVVIPSQLNSQTKEFFFKTL